MTAFALLLAACGGTDDAPIVDDGDDPAATDGGDPSDPDPDDAVDPDGEADPSAGSPDAGAATCEELEDRAYDPPAAEQPTPDPDLTDAEPVTDIEPLDDPAIDDTGNSDAAPRAPMSRLDQVWEWAFREAPDHFGGVWIDPEEGSPTVIGFTDDLDGYAEEVRSSFGEGWWVVEVDTTYEELQAVQDRLNVEEMGERQLTDDGDPVPGSVMGSGLRATINRVVVTVFEPDDDRLEELSERYGADAICLEVMSAPTTDDARPSPWEPAEDADVSATSTSIDVLVQERDCASGQSAEDRLVDPEIVYDDDAVIVTIGIVPSLGDQTCPENPDTPTTIDLDEPLGDRELLDGREDPPVPPSLAGER